MADHFVFGDNPEVPGHPEGVDISLEESNIYGSTNMINYSGSRLVARNSRIIFSREGNLVMHMQFTQELQIWLNYTIVKSLAVLVYT